MDATKDKYQFEVTWRPFLLRHDTPPEGTPKAPNTPSNPRVNPRLKAVGEAVGVNFTGACDVRPNTVPGHMLTDLATKQGKADELQNVLFRNYFTDGIDIGNKDNLMKAAVEAGLEAASAAAALKDAALEKRVRQEAKEYSMRGVSGVPFFIIGDTPAFSGAQDPSAFYKHFEEAAEPASSSK